MSRKPISLRSAVITTVAFAAGSASGTAAEAMAAHLGYTPPGISQLVTAIITLWAADKLHNLIDGTNDQDARN